MIDNGIYPSLYEHSDGRSEKSANLGDVQAKPLAFRTPYHYTPLDQGSQHIRLFQLFPGKDGQQVAGTLTTHTLIDSPQYEALSYLWGNPSRNSQITLDYDGGFMITRNLKLALHDLRLKENTRTLWVDALCINQTNVEEKNHQVKMMGEIYQRAIRVVAWIECEVDPSHPAFADLLGTETHGASDNLETTWKVVGSIFLNKYWTRVWIQQELILAREFEIHCRKFVLREGTVSALLERFRNRNKFGRVGYLNEYDARIGFEYFKLIGEARVHRLPEWKTYEEAMATTLMDCYIPDVLMSPLRFGCLLSCLNRFRHLDATDERDKVYALLSLANDFEMGDISIDYGRPLADVFVSVCEFILRRYNSLDFLCVAVLPRLYPFSRDNPTWAPDWDTISVRGHLSISRASGALRPLDPANAIRNRVLRARGFRLDGVYFVPDGYKTDRTPLESIWELTWELFELVWALRSKWLGKTGKPGEALEEGPYAWKQFLYTMSKGGRRPGRTHNLTMPELARGCDEFRNLCKRPETSCLGLIHLEDSSTFKEAQPDVQGLVHAIGHMFSQHIRVVLEQGRLGLVVHGPVQAHDEVWIIFGCSTPVVLRRPLDPKDDHYLFVCPIYIDGFMNGEAVEGISDEVEGGAQSGIYQVRTIELC